jgi:hypothetical protein
VPYGLVFYETMARAAGVEAHHISAAITLLSCVCARDFRRENPVLADLALDGASPAAILERCRAG